MDRLITTRASPSRAATMVGPQGSQMSSQMFSPMWTPAKSTMPVRSPGVK